MDQQENGITGESTDPLDPSESGNQSSSESEGFGSISSDSVEDGVGPDGVPVESDSDAIEDSLAGATSNVNKGPRVVLPASIREPVEQEPEGEPTAVVFRPFRSIVSAFGLGLMGAVAWAVVTWITNYQLGLVAILIGILAGNGAARGGRCRAAQWVGAIAGLFCFFIGQLMIYFIIEFTRTPEQQSGASELLAQFAESFGPVMMMIIAKTFSGIQAIFLGFAVWEGWTQAREK